MRKATKATDLVSRTPAFDLRKVPAYGFVLDIDNYKTTNHV